METPETRYARRRGLHIGYQVWGAGPVDILDMGCGTYISIDDAAEEPHWRRYTERLAGWGRVIRFDISGVGLSDAPTFEGLTLQTWVDDALAVMDAVGSTRAVVLAASNASLTGLLFAAQHPGRTRSLVLVNGSARYQEAPDYPIGIPRSLVEEFRAGLDPDGDPAGDDVNDLRLFAPSAADDVQFQQWWSRASRRGAGPAAASVFSRLNVEADVRQVLPRIEAPTLVLHRRDALAPGHDHGQYLAEHIAGARLVSLVGDDVMPFVGDVDELVDEVQEFVTGDHYQAGRDRALATIVFTDIVDSTGTAARLGDRRWTQVLFDHDALVRRQLTRFGGDFVKDTGDGLLATFDGPSRAIRFASAVRLGAANLGIRIRAGLHAGEIERRGEDVSGIAVHVAARVAASAEPDEILVTDVMVDLVEGAGIEFEDRGDRALKGVARPRRVWSVLRA